MACWVFRGRGMGWDTRIYTFTGCFTNPSWGASTYGADTQAPYDNGVAQFNGWASQQNTLTRVFCHNFQKYVLFLIHSKLHEIFFV